MEQIIRIPNICKQCGAPHHMGIQNMETGITEPIDVCKDCLFRPWDQRVETSWTCKLENMSMEDMQRELAETELRVLQSEYGTCGNVGFAQGKMCDADGMEVNIKCKCGNEATSVMMGKESYMGLCNKCQYGES